MLEECFERSLETEINRFSGRISMLKFFISKNELSKCRYFLKVSRSIA